MSKIYYTIDEKYQVSDKQFSEILAGQEFLNRFIKGGSIISFQKYSWIIKDEKELPVVLAYPDDPQAQLYLTKALCSGVSAEELEKKYHIKLFTGGSVELGEYEKYVMSGSIMLEKGYYEYFGYLERLFVYSFLFWVSEKLADVEIKIFDKNLFFEDVPFWFILKNGKFVPDWKKYEITFESYQYAFDKKWKQMELYRRILPQNRFFVDKPLADGKNDKILSETDALILGWKKSISELSRLNCSDFSEWLSKQKLPNANGFYFINLKPYFFSISESLIKKA